MSKDINILIESEFNEQGVEKAKRSVKSLIKDLDNYDLQLTSNNKLQKQGTKGVIDNAKAQKIMGKIIKKNTAEVTRFKGEYLSLMFAGMALTKVFGSFFKSITNIQKKSTGQATKYTQQVNKLKASFIFLGFAIGDAFAQSGVLAWFVGGIVKVVDVLSQFISKHPMVAAFIVTIAGIGFAVGKLFTGVFMTALALESMGMLKMGTLKNTLKGVKGLMRGMLVTSIMIGAAIAGWAVGTKLAEKTFGTKDEQEIDKDTADLIALKRAQGKDRQADALKRNLFKGENYKGLLGLMNKGVTNADIGTTTWQYEGRTSAANSVTEIINEQDLAKSKPEYLTGGASRHGYFGNTEQVQQAYGTTPTGGGVEGQDEFITGIMEGLDEKIAAIEESAEVVNTQLEDVLGKDDSALSTAGSQLDTMSGKIKNTTTPAVTTFSEAMVTGAENVTTSINSMIASAGILAKAAADAETNAGSKQFGGFVGQTGSYLLHAGERVVPAGSTTDVGGVNVTVNGSGDPSAIARSVSATIAADLRREMNMIGR